MGRTLPLFFSYRRSTEEQAAAGVPPTPIER